MRYDTETSLSGPHKTTRGRSTNNLPGTIPSKLKPLKSLVITDLKDDNEPF